MKLRIAHIDDSRRMAGMFAVQSSFFGILWDTIYFNPSKKELSAEYVLGRGKLEKAEFDDYHDAVRYAQKFKQSYCHKQIIRETWRI